MILADPFSEGDTVGASILKKDNSLYEINNL